MGPCRLLANVRFLEIVTRLRGFRSKIAFFFFHGLHCLAIPRRGLSTNKKRARRASIGIEIGGHLSMREKFVKTLPYVRTSFPGGEK